MIKMINFMLCAFYHNKNKSIIWSLLYILLPSTSHCHSLHNKNKRETLNQHWLCQQGLFLTRKERWERNEDDKYKQGLFVLLSSPFWANQTHRLQMGPSRVRYWNGGIFQITISRSLNSWTTEVVLGKIIIVNNHLLNNYLSATMLCHLYMQHSSNIQSFLEIG